MIKYLFLCVVHLRVTKNLSERDFNCYIKFRIILFHFHFTIFGFEFPHNIVNPITVCYRFTLAGISAPFTEIFNVGPTSKFLYQLVSEP
jgi:hypothetical protein